MNITSGREKKINLLFIFEENMFVYVYIYIRISLMIDLFSNSNYI